MTASLYRQLWTDLKDRNGDPEALEHLARQTAAAFMDAYLGDGRYEEDHIRLLCEMATYQRDASSKQAVTRILFGVIVERLCDEFEELPTETYNRVISQVVSFCRRLPAGGDLDRRLADAGLNTQQDIIARQQRIRKPRPTLTPGRAPQKILVLSRVTIGADVAVTSIILQRLGELFPATERILLGDAKITEIFGGCDGLTIAPLTYRRNGDLFERLQSWHQAADAVAVHQGAGAEERTVLIDPDSRLTQLGVLPLMPENRYFYFDSRSTGTQPDRLSIGALTNAWLDRITGTRAFCHPKIWPRPNHLEAAAAFCGQLRRGGVGRLVMVNFGVGGNPRKRVGRQFEHALLAALLQEPHTIVLLDRGLGREESLNATALADGLRRQGHPVRSASMGEGWEENLDRGVVSLQLGIGELAAITACCDEYIGYDSAGQHIATALQIPCVTVFAGSNSMRFIQRWSALGPGKRHIVHVDTLTDPGAVDIADVIGRVMIARGRA